MIAWFYDGTQLPVPSWDSEDGVLHPSRDTERTANLRGRIPASIPTGLGAHPWESGKQWTQTNRPIGPPVAPVSADTEH